MFGAMREVSHFYGRLEPMPGAVELFGRLYEKYGNRCEILSGIPKPGRGIVNAGDDKTVWVHRILTPDVVVNIVYREEKQNYCTGPGCILIDDYEKNIEEWEAMGGTGVLFTDSESAAEKLKEMGIL